MVNHGEAIRRHELSAQEWESLAPLVPRAATGRPRAEDRQLINGTVCNIRTGISRRDLPERHGPCKTVCPRFSRYALDGVFTRALQQVQAHADEAGDTDRLVQIDSRHAAMAPSDDVPQQFLPAHCAVASTVSSDLRCSFGLEAAEPALDVRRGLRGNDARRDARRAYGSDQTPWREFGRYPVSRPP
ncbi:transposase [Streptomyces sp. AK04-3B]|uniref:transposase n=1 Tax=Streptomyces sp. AK04-3B TaxID=3028650 RepID=UPI0039F46469